MAIIDDTDHATPGYHPCGRCAQTGDFITGTLNGKPTGPGGPCFRCNGAGYHDQADRRRNHWHDIHAMAEAAHAMAHEEPDYDERLAAWDRNHCRQR